MQNEPQKKEEADQSDRLTTDFFDPWQTQFASDNKRNEFVKALEKAGNDEF